MTSTLLLVAAIILLCVLLNKVSSRLGVPMLLFFIVLGMLFGSDGIIKIAFDNYSAAEHISSIAMVFIMFYGGFGTKWSAARPVAAKAVLLSSLGTFLTAGLVGVFCHFAMKIPLLESFLIGSVISSTDAASVFSILRSKRLNLKYNTASLLEVESGSNDPFSYMLTVIMLALMGGDVTAGKFIYLLFSQVVFGAVCGVAIAFAALAVIRKFRFNSGGFDVIFIVAVAILSYAVPLCIGGNGFLSAYISGIILGNSRIPNKQELVSFFDVATGLMQMLLFFMLGLLSFPSQLPDVALTALAIAVFLTFVARPVAVFAILTPFGSKIRKQLLVSWAGMRGAASIVFAIMTVINPAVTDNDIFHIVFFIVLFSILLQGSLLPFVSKKLGMIAKDADVMKTFTDYADEVPVQFLKFTIPENHPWAGKLIKDITLPPDSLFLLITNGDERIIPNGLTPLSAGDTVIMSGESADGAEDIKLYERAVKKDGKWEGKPIRDISSDGMFIVMVKRDGGVVIPNGDTVLLENDILVMIDTQRLTSMNITAS